VSLQTTTYISASLGLEPLEMNSIMTLEQLWNY